MIRRPSATRSGLVAVYYTRKQGQLFLLESGPVTRDDCHTYIILPLVSLLPLHEWKSARTLHGDCQPSLDYTKAFPKRTHGTNICTLTSITSSPSAAMLDLAVEPKSQEPRARPGNNASEPRLAHYGTTRLGLARLLSWAFFSINYLLVIALCYWTYFWLHNWNCVPFRETLAFEIVITTTEFQNM